MRPYRLLITLALAALAVFALVQFLTSRTSLEFVLAQAKSQLSNELGLTLEVGELQVSAGDTSLSASPIIITDQEGEILFTAERVKVDVEAIPFFSKKIVLNSLVVESPSLNLRLRDGKVLGLKERKQQKRKKKTKLPFVSSENILIKDARIKVVVDDKHTLTLANIRARLKERGEDGHRLKFSVGEGALAFSDKAQVQRHVVLDAFDGRLSLHGNGLLAPERVGISGVSLSTTQAELDVSGSVLLGDLRLAPALDLDVGLRSSFAPLATALGLPVALSGDAQISARISSDFGAKDFVIRGQNDLRDFKIKTFGIGSMRNAFELTKDRLVISQAEVDNGGTTVRGEVSMELKKPFALSGKASGKKYSVAQLLKDLHGTRAWANLVVDDGAVEFTGTLAPFKLEGSGGGVIGSVRVGSSAESELSDEELVLRTIYPLETRTDFLVDSSKIQFDGSIDDGKTKADGLVNIYLDASKGMDLEAVVESCDFDSIGGRIASLDFTGIGSGTVSAKGPYSDIVIESDSILNNFSLSGFEFGDLAGHIVYDQSNTKLSFQKVKAKKNKSLYEGDVDLTFGRRNEVLVRQQDNTFAPTIKRGLHIGVDIIVRDAQAQDLRAVIPNTYTSGVLGFLRELEFDGPVSGPMRAEGYIGGGSTRALVGNATFGVRKGAKLLTQTLEGGTFRVEMDHEKVTIPSIDLRIAGGSARADLTIDRDSSKLDGNFALENLELAKLDPLKDSSRVFSGRASAKGTLNAVSDNPGASGRLVLEDAAWGTIPIGNADFSLEHQDRSLLLEGAMLSERGEGEIVVATRSPFKYSAAIALLEGPLAPLLPKDLLPQGLKTSARGSVFSNGALKGFSDSRGTIVLDKASFDYKEFSLSSTGDVLAHFNGPRLTVDQLEMVSQRSDTLTLQGLIATDDLDMQLRAQGGLWFVPAFSKRIKSADGTFRFDLALTGDLDNALTNGSGRINDGTFVTDIIDPVIQNFDARFLFSANRVELERARGDIGESPAILSGGIELKNLSPDVYDLKLNYKDLDLTTPSWLATRTSGDLTLKGDVDFPTLSGDVFVQSAVYDEDIDWDRLLPDLSRKIKAPQVFDKSDEDMRLDVHLVADRGIAVRNNTMDLEAKGELTLTGTEERPGLLGNLSLLGGNATFRNNRYNLARGTIEFTETFRIAPLFNIDVETRVRDYEVAARLFGPIGGLKIDLSSKPELDEIDIVSLLTFGFTQFEASADSGQSVGISGVLEVVSAYTGLEDEVERILPKALRDASGLAVNELRLTSIFSTADGTNRPAVAVGFEVDPKIALIGGSRLRLQSTLIETDGNGNQQTAEWSKRFDNDVRLRVIWRSLDRGSCSTCRNQWGDPGFDFWYRWEFQ